MVNRPDGWNELAAAWLDQTAVHTCLGASRNRVAIAETQNETRLRSRFLPDSSGCADKGSVEGGGQVLVEP